MSKYTDSVLREVLPQRSVSDASFGQGIQDYIWSTGGTTSFIPSKSYLRIGVELYSNRTGPVFAQPALKDLIAPADNLCGNLYNNAQMYAGGRQVSQIVNGLAQASALKARLLRHGAWNDTMGKDAYLSEAEFVERQRYVCSDAQKSSLSPDVTISPLTTVVGNQRTATVAIDINGVVAGGNTEFDTVLADGDTLVVGGERFQVVDRATGTDMAATVTPKPTVAIVPTPDAYIIKQSNSVSDGHNKFYVMWKPPLGFFDLDDPQAAGDYRLSLNPSQNYKSAAIETLLGANGDATSIENYDLRITDVRLYLHTVQTSIPMDIKSTIFEQNVQSKPFTTASNTLNFTVPSSTKAISVWVQSDDAGTNPLIPPSMFKCFANGGIDKPHLALESIQLTFANTTKPSVRWSSAYTDDTNQLQQRYRDCYADAGMLTSSGGVERFEDYLTRGPIYHFDFSRTADDNSTELQVSASFAGALGAGVSMYVCSWYTRVVDIASRGGTIQSVESRVA
jgi:hypothetical protein